MLSTKYEGRTVSKIGQREMQIKKATFSILVT